MSNQGVWCFQNYLSNGDYICTTLPVAQKKNVTEKKVWKAGPNVNSYDDQGGTRVEISNK